MKKNRYGISYKITGSEYWDDDITWYCQFEARTKYEAVAQLVDMEDREHNIVTEISNISEGSIE